jgi:hypothetical protein
MKPRWPSQAMFFPGRFVAKTGFRQEKTGFLRPGEHAVTAADNLLTGRLLTPRRRAALLKRQKAPHA